MRVTVVFPDLSSVIKASSDPQSGAQVCSVSPIKRFSSVVLSVPLHFEVQHLYVIVQSLLSLWSLSSLPALRIRVFLFIEGITVSLGADDPKLFGPVVGSPVVWSPVVGSPVVDCPGDVSVDGPVYGPLSGVTGLNSSDTVILGSYLGSEYVGLGMVLDVSSYRCSSKSAMVLSQVSSSIGVLK